MTQKKQSKAKTQKKAAKVSTKKDKKPAKKAERKEPKGTFKLVQFGDAILHKREKDDLSLRGIEAETGIAKSTLQAIEAKAKYPTAEVLAAILKWLNLPANQFFA